jgi:hypothetical protein
MHHGLQRRIRPAMRRHLARNAVPWPAAARNATYSGAIAAGTTALCTAVAGRRDSGSAVAPINATGHIVWGDSAGAVADADVRHTVPGALLHAGACVFWAVFYEKLFGRAAARGDLATAMLGGAAVAAAAYVTDYHVVPKRLTPGWEARLSGRSLAAVYAVLALSLPLRGLLRR